MENLINIVELEKIMNQHTESLLRLSYYYVKDLHIAEDIVQESFIKFYQDRNRYEERGELNAYLSKIVVNKSKDYLKSWSYRKIQLQNRLFSKHSQKKLDNLIRKDEESILGEAILKLPLKQREPLIYFYFEEMSIKDISKLLEIPESTVKTRLRRSKQLLKTQLQKYEWEVLLNE
ncbi:sigma-70 family RNA polymerase sigma factor [Rummeliibacillus sp. NPDC094406]|uniref:sigma-70 family RNA polymerase sigma factor n=1 Tax=Rummeliibacillus sp. NPDC094406 TaxID=3364511 RepID=UPI003828F0AF